MREAHHEEPAVRIVRSRELTVRICYQSPTGGFDEEAELESAGPRGRETGEECFYCWEDDGGEEPVGLCDAHALEESIADLGALEWLEDVLDQRHWKALQAGSPFQAITITGHVIRTRWSGAGGFDCEDEEDFDASSIEITEDTGRTKT